MARSSCCCTLVWFRLCTAQFSVRLLRDCLQHVDGCLAELSCHVQQKPGLAHLPRPSRELNAPRKLLAQPRLEHATAWPSRPQVQSWSNNYSTIVAGGQTGPAFVFRPC